MKKNYLQRVFFVCVWNGCTLRMSARIYIYKRWYEYIVVSWVRLYEWSEEWISLDRGYLSAKDSIAYEYGEHVKGSFIHYEVNHESDPP
jgi:hypothetical protein